METDSPDPHSLADRVRSALDRQQHRPGPEEAVGQVRRLFEEAFGGQPPEPIAARAFLPLIAEHTYYFEGFGLLARLPGGVAVAARPAVGPVRVVGTGVRTELLVQLAVAIRDRLGGGTEGGVEAAVATSVWGGGEEPALGAIAYALQRALGGEASPDVRVATEAVADVLGRPYSPAYALAAEVDAPLALVDCGAEEAVAVDQPDAVAFGVVEAAAPDAPDAHTFSARADLLESALERLQRRGRGDLASLRQLEHRDLPAALDRLRSPQRDLVRHLVTEDRRVPRLVAALRRGDGQLVGALLLMSQASLRDELGVPSEAADAVVEAGQGTDGVYGVRMVGPAFGEHLLVAGRPFLLPDFLDATAERLGASSGRRHVALLL